MRGPLLPGETRPVTGGPSLFRLVALLARHEAAMRDVGQEILRHLDPDDDLAISVRRMLEALEQC